ncbi:DUF5811 family protein [Halomarina litorea]|uniref:DUF5811 family protein n=1 Tax=Halomarina litorea TaxID=2961595 RepID=UPI0020C31033|nr:DUF5811 family protein [Halomarina sp. BCD28]
MHGNTPYAGKRAESEDLSAEEVELLRRDLRALAERTRSLLPDEFVVGSEIRNGSNGPRATVAVQPPVGKLVSTGLAADATTEERDALVHELAAGAAIQVKHAIDDVSPTAG